MAKLFRVLASAAALFAAVLCLASGALAQGPMPDVAYDPAIPTQEQVLGDAWGARVTAPDDVIAYFRALEAASGGRMLVRPYAESWQGRELVYAVIGSAENIAALADFDAGMARLADPRTLSTEGADSLIADLPGSVWLAHGVHGDEISSAEAAMATAYHLLAAQGDAVVDGILSNTLVFIDPVQNPDGRARFVQEYYDTIGLAPNGSPISAERLQRWPGGRYNHYLFDMNRDWFALTQPETRGRIAAYLEHFPLVFVDLHEMGSDSTYFFSPEAIPYNPDITESQREALELIGRNNARWFDRFGFAYYTREVYDAFYPGYGAAWPLFHGTIGTTYEQAGADGLSARRFDGTDITYVEGARHHFTSSMATLETVSTNREQLLRAFYEYRVSAIDEGARDGRAYILPIQDDQASADKLAGLLAMQGIEIGRAEAAFAACRVNYDAGAYIVPADQPAGRLVRTLLEPHVQLEEEFLAEQERRRARDLGVEIYDVVAWSVPLQFNVQVDRCAERLSVERGAVAPAFVTPGVVENMEAAYGFLAPWGSAASARLLARLLSEGIPVASADAGFTLGERSYPAGTLIVRTGGDPALAQRLAALAVETGADLVGVDDSWVTDGPSFGSERVFPMPAPRVAIAWDEPTDPTGAGSARFVLERQLGWPATPVAVSDLGSDDLSQFDVLILPDGDGYMDALGMGGAGALAAWVERGGSLIALGGAARLVADPEAGLGSLRREDAAAPADAAPGKDAASSTVPGEILTTRDELAAAETPLGGDLDASPGVLLRAETNPDHWLAAGVKPILHVLMVGGDIYAPPKRDEATTVVSFAPPEELLASGHLWDETLAQTAFKPVVVVEPRGRGQVIVFTQNPTTRAYLDGLQLLFANAVFRGAAHARPAR